MIKEEQLCRKEFGYKKMTDRLLDKFLDLQDKANQDSGYLKWETNHKEIMNAPSYDILHMSEWNRQFKYAPMWYRKESVDYSSMNEVRWILDYAYYFDTWDID